MSCFQSKNHKEYNGKIIAKETIQSEAYTDPTTNLSTLSMKCIEFIQCNILFFNVQRELIRIWALGYTNFYILTVFSYHTEIIWNCCTCSTIAMCLHYLYSWSHFSYVSGWLSLEWRRSCLSFSWQYFRKKKKITNVRWIVDNIIKLLLHCWEQNNLIVFKHFTRSRMCIGKPYTISYKSRKVIIIIDLWPQ